MRVARAQLLAVACAGLFPLPAAAQLLPVDAGALLQDDRRALAGSFVAVEPGSAQRPWSVALSHFETLPPPTNFLATRLLAGERLIRLTDAPAIMPRHHDYVGIVNAELGRGRRRLPGGSIIGITISDNPAGGDQTVRMGGVVGALGRLDPDDR